MRTEEDIKKELKEKNKDMRMREANVRLNPATGGMAYSASVGLYYAFSLLILMLLVIFKADKNEEIVTYANYLAAPLAIFLCTVLILRFRNIRFKAVFHFKCKFRYYIIALLLVFGLLFSLSWINDLSLKFFKLFGYNERESYFPNLSGGYIVPALLVIALLPAVFEECLFRGLMLSCCRTSMGGVATIFTVGFCFSLFHGSPEQTFYQFIAGCVFTFIALRSGSILPSVLMHFLNNAVIVVLQACGALGGDGALKISAGGSIALIVVSAACFIGAIVWLSLDGIPLRKSEKHASRSFYMFASFGIFAMAVVWTTTLFGLG